MSSPVQKTFVENKDDILVNPWLNSFGKRVFDVVSATVLLTLATPVMAVVAVGVKFDSPGPIIFKQKRVGRDGKLFDILKFRSVRHDAAEPTDEKPVTHNDPRVTKFGAHIRRRRLDELPQFFNVLWGDMSLVGPRAMTKHALDRLFPHDYQMKRLGFKPGLTSVSAMKGYRRIRENPADKLTIMQEEKDYLANASPLTDLKIMLNTPTIMFKPPANNC